MGSPKWIAMILLASFVMATIPNPPPQESSPLANTYTVCPGGLPTCDYTSIQAAVDAARHGDTIKVAVGTYTDIHSRPAPAGYHGPPQVVQTVYVSKSVDIQGGYDLNFLEPPDPIANPTILDAQGLGRVLFIVGPITPSIAGLQMTSGDAGGLGGAHGTIPGIDAGGGVYVLTATAIFSANKIFSNTAEAGGGAYLYHSSATLVSNSLYINRASAYGGGLFLGACYATLRENTILTNRANEGGGAYLHSSSDLLAHNTFSTNTAYLGGGLYLYSSTATLDSNSIVANVGEQLGGGLDLDYSPTIFVGNSITDNTADFGGGLFLAHSPSTFTGNVISANTANHWKGGGLLLSWSDSTLINNLIVDGGGVWVSASAVRLLHNTLARNGGSDGSGLSVTEGCSYTDCDYSRVHLTNTILVSHTLGITVSAGCTVTLEATLWGTGAWANRMDWAGQGNVSTGTINLWSLPNFVAPGMGDYHIEANSPARENGMETGVHTDVDNQPRPYLLPDIGADEYWPPNEFRILLPLIIK